MTKQEQTIAMTEKTQELIQDILSELTRLEKQSQHDWKSGIEKLTQNAVHNMSWVAKDIYVGQYMENKYRKIASVVRQNESDIHGNLILALEEIFEMYEYYLSQPFNLRVKSTCEVSQMTSTWEYECQLNAKNLVKKLLKQIKKETYSNN
jgi:hypothetical protein